MKRRERNGFILTLLSLWSRGCSVKALKQKIKREKNKNRKLWEMAYFDSLTHLPNRNLVAEKLEDAFLAAKTENKAIAVVYIDLDDFKQINDTNGHHIGDLVLEEVAKRIAKAVCKDDLLGRIGGDEFALIIERNLTEQEVIAYVEEIQETLQKSLRVQKLEIRIHASFGISMYPRDGKDTAELLAHSDMAMYQVKKEGKNGVHIYLHSAL